MELGLRTLKRLFGLMGFGVLIVLSFLIISDVEKTFTLWYSTALVSPVYESTPEPVSSTQNLPQAPRPPALMEPVPRIVVLDAERYIAQNGYPLTAFVDFGEYRLSFHLANDVDITYAQQTILSIMEVFDTVYNFFVGGAFYDFYLVAGPCDLVNRRISYNLTAAPHRGAATYLFFVQSQRHHLPKWLCSGLENYLMGGGDVMPLSDEDLVALLGQGAGGSSFGDAWFIPAFRPRTVSADDIQNVAYTFVRRWSQAGELYDFVRLAQADIRAFATVFESYIAELTGNADVLEFHFQYRFGDFEIMTAHGSYIFVYDSYVWAWTRVLNFIDYMDAAIEYVSYRFTIDSIDNIRVNIYPFGVVSIPDAIAEMAYMFGWDAPDVNFVSNDEITLAGTARFGTWAISHEVAHILLFREFPGYHPTTWMSEGMAVLGELLFRDAFEGVRPYRFAVPMLSNIDAKSRDGNGHNLPFFYGEYSFGRNSWTYDDAGSFVLYLYNNFGIEALLEMYKSDNYSQFEMAVEIFGIELEELMNNWRRFLWPGDEPIGWWTR